MENAFLGRAQFSCVKQITKGTTTKHHSMTNRQLPTSAKIPKCKTCHLLRHSHPANTDATEKPSEITNAVLSLKATTSKHYSIPSILKFKNPSPTKTSASRKTLVYSAKATGKLFVGGGVVPVNDI